VTNLLEPLFVHRVRGRISSSPLLADANADGWPEVFVGGPVLTGLSWDGEQLPRWPRRSRKPFASSPAFGDINGDGRGEIVVGCDDGQVHAFYPDGDPVGGWPIRTGRDVFSTTVLADVNHDKAAEVVVGSDDGSLYVLRGDGRRVWRAELRGRPFISGSPAVADLDGDGSPEIAVGAWDRQIHVWSGDGEEHSTLGPTAGNAIWSSPLAFMLRGGAGHLAWASDMAFVGSLRGGVLPGWPARTESWIVSSPAVVELSGGSGASVVVGAERLYAWDLFGRPRPGWPVDLGDFVWSSPIAFDLDGDGSREVLAGSWDGGLYAFRSDGTPVPGFPVRTEGPIFSTPAAAPLRGGGGLLVAASWDGTVRGWRLPRAKFGPGDWLQFRGSPTRTGLQPQPFEPPQGAPLEDKEIASRPRVHAAHEERWPTGHGIHRIVAHGEALHRAKGLRLVYEILGEGREHIAPFVNSRGATVALVQPLRIPRPVRYRIEFDGPDGRIHRWPPNGGRRFLSRTTLCAR